MAWIDMDAEGVRVHRTTVETVEPAPTPDHWVVSTERGTATVDIHGIGPEAVPLDPDIDADIYLYGDGFLVTSTLLGVEHGADQDHAADQGDDLGLV